MTASHLSPLSIPFFTARTETGAQCDAWPDQPLLVSLEQGGLDWPSSCRNGTCRTCIGQLVEGRVRYEIEWPGLSPEERAGGCVLPCVAYPETDVVLEKATG
ncbi:ferredoxin [Rhodococcus sp. SRB_17]|uniref:2Fe-2S iron-sulfur cluster-binding protein n=1 Tax=Acidovorax sp. SRB_24 TaxID=1962700 RepID=UPI00145D037B|nr:2Fe-2S iron-sulfur cluster binding domain-containing protein [Acidovorax sp. SRB_24]NMM77444.1 ferredoxin [Acidovorax sp. SRB_24]NMM87044.1 ferredoxin [Rhodococcus sp. SRB_17]